LAEELKQNKIPMEKFEILKQLTKAPKDYSDSKALPHVNVALRLNEKESVKLHQGDVVKYVICQVKF
jgi:DNA polymerase alpha subunit A